MLPIIFSALTDDGPKVFVFVFQVALLALTVAKTELTLVSKLAMSTTPETPVTTAVLLTSPENLSVGTVKFVDDESVPV